ncbi:MAG: NAD-dependent epimerase/dehydratase family protein [Candidatus Omnitrophica bacterium]|nr:NAD-dependent epimerase/dehydratase family protein [Candidatus Omnitrophota bacterium]
MNINGKNILITGATGFVGANLVRYFINKKARVNIFKRKQSELWRINDIKNKFFSHDVNLLNHADVKRAVKIIKPEVVIHTATYGGHVTQRNIPLIFKTNFDATINLLDSSLKSGAGIFINTGSSSEYGLKNCPMKETDVLKPITPYGASKALATIYCQYAAKKFSVPVVTLRLFSPYGYYDDVNRAVSYLILSCLRKTPLNIKSPDSVRDFVFIEDVIESYGNVLRNSSNLSGEIFNIGSGKQYSIKYLAEKIARLTGMNAQLSFQKKNKTLMTEPKTWVADCSLSFKELGWSPKFNIEGGLKKTINWFRSNIGLYS